MSDNKIPDIGLLKSNIDQILTVVKKQKKIRKVLLFGSRAKGTFAPGSDIDLAISGIDLVTRDLLEILVGLDDLNLPYKFDVIIYERIKEKELLDHINRVGIVLDDSCNRD